MKQTKNTNTPPPIYPATRLEILTIAEMTAARFDARVNEAIADGWRLEKRYYAQDGLFIAEMTKKVDVV